MTYHFEIEGKPFPKQRPRFVRATGRAYTPKETVSFEQRVGEIAGEAIPSPLTGPIVITIEAIFKPAKSWSQKKRDASMRKPHTQRPDLDNIGKAIMDGLNGVAFVDDSQVYQIILHKSWGEEECTRIQVEER